MCFRELKGRLINYHKIWIRGDIKHKHQTLNTWGYVTVGKIQRMRKSKSPTSTHFPKYPEYDNKLLTCLGYWIQTSLQNLSSQVRLLDKVLRVLWSSGHLASLSRKKSRVRIPSEPQNLGIIKGLRNKELQGAPPYFHIILSLMILFYMCMNVGQGNIFHCLELIIKTSISQVRYPPNLTLIKFPSVHHLISWIMIDRMST